MSDFYSAHVEHLCLDERGNEVIIMGLNKKHQNLCTLGGLRDAEKHETPLETATREYEEESLGVLWNRSKLEARIREVLSGGDSGTFIKRADTKGFLHWHFFIRDEMMRTQQ